MHAFCWRATGPTHIITKRKSVLRCWLWLPSTYLLHICNNTPISQPKSNKDVCHVMTKNRKKNEKKHRGQATAFQFHEKRRTLESVHVFLSVSDMRNDGKSWMKSERRVWRTQSTHIKLRLKAHCTYCTGASTHCSSSSTQSNSFQFNSINCYIHKEQEAILPTSCLLHKADIFRKGQKKITVKNIPQTVKKSLLSE